MTNDYRPITFRQTMDTRSFDVYKGDDKLAMIQWHPTHEPHIVWTVPDPLFFSVSLADCEKIAAELRRLIVKSRPLPGFGGP